MTFGSLGKQETLEQKKFDETALLFTFLSFTINKKPIFEPTTKIEHLGFIIDSNQRTSGFQLV